jgi:hypothetical protein
MQGQSLQVRFIEFVMRTCCAIDQLMLVIRLKSNACRIFIVTEIYLPPSYPAYCLILHLIRSGGGKSF